MPVYNDWQPLKQLVEKIQVLCSEEKIPQPLFVIVNDGSVPPSIEGLPAGDSRLMEVIHLNRNAGHQKAIAIGLSHIHHHHDPEFTVIMDADGEDRPESIGTFLKAHKENPEKIILAKRTKRKDNFSFLFWYWVYKLFFLLLTGRKIAYGNFSLIPKAQNDRLVYYSEIWNNLAGGILKSGLPYLSLPIEKGYRLSGESKMNFSSLVIHGLNTIAVFIESICIRILIFSGILILLSLLSILSIAAIRIFTPYAIPGWASILASIFTAVLLQSFLIALIIIVIFLSSQSQRKFIPALHYREMINKIEKFYNE